nr:glutaminase [Paenibacillus elgii]
MIGDIARSYEAQTERQQLDRLDEWVNHYRSFAAEGQCAAYIPALARANPSHLGICIAGPDGIAATSGDTNVSFTMQSISKVISFIAACLHRGVPYVLERVDLEPTGDPFNSMLRLELHKPGKPFNPMINAGAITVASLLPGESPAQKMDSFCSLLEIMLGKRPTVNEEVFQSECKTGHRNRALAYYLSETGYLEVEVEHALEVYFKQCSIETDIQDIAMIGLILALDGCHPVSKKQLIPKDIARLTKSLMLTCGMYNASGKFAAFVGLPAKSGVSGGIMALVPPRSRPEALFRDGCGIGIYGPAIDSHGNSVAGVKLLQHIAQNWDLSIF